jgi:hypothetical protein
MVLLTTTSASASTSTSRQPTQQREVLGREVDSTEKNPVSLEGKQSDRDMLGRGSSIRTLSLCSDDFEDSECDENRPDQGLRSPLKVSSASHIRSRFLNHLGISRPERAQTEQHPKRISSGPCSGSFFVTLKADRGKPDNALDEISSSLTTVASSNTSMRRSVTFDTDVTVHPIPRKNKNAACGNSFYKSCRLEIVDPFIPYTYTFLPFAPTAKQATADSSIGPSAVYFCKYILSVSSTLLLTSNRPS